MDLLLDVNIVVDLCAPRMEWYPPAKMALACCKRHGDRVWLYAGSVQTLEYSLRRVLLDKVEEQGQRMTGRAAGHMARAILREFAEDKHWLAALAGEGHVFASEDPEDEQLLRALDRFAPGEIVLLTRDKILLGKDPGRTMTPEIYCQQAPANGLLDFIDLKAQQDLIRPQLECAVHRVLHHGQYIMGPEIEALEEKLVAEVGVKHAIMCSSGTDALLIALMALDIGPGDEVVTVPYTWISSAEVMALLGAKPVFADIESDTFNMDPERIEVAITSRTRAIMPVCIYGQCANMTRINALAEKHGLPVIEDGAQSFGATHCGRKSCGLSEIGCTSFFPSKPLGCYGDGGAIFTDDDALADKMRQIRVHGQKVKHQHPRVGVNGRLDTVQAAILLEKLAIFPEECNRRWEVGKRYDRLLADIPDIRTPVIAAGNDSVYAQYTILSPKREALSVASKTAGIPSVAYYTVPLHLQGAFRKLGYKQGDFPVAEQVASQCLSLPMSPYLRVADQERIAAVLQGIVRM